MESEAPKQVWKMRRIAANEHSQLWHLEVNRINGNYVTACGLRFGIAGSLSKVGAPGTACAKCLKKSD